MTDILILATESSVVRDLCAVVKDAGYHPHTPEAGEDAVAALHRTTPDVVLLDCGLVVPAGLVPAAVRLGSCPVYIGPCWSPYTLAACARSAGVHHYVLTSGAAGLRALVDDLALTIALSSHSRGSARPSTLGGGALAERARPRTQQPREVRADVRELHAARRIALAACRLNHELLRNTVTDCTRELRSEGIPLDAVRSLVRCAVEVTGAAGSAALRAEAESEARAAEEWCVEAYRAA